MSLHDILIESGFSFEEDLARHIPEECPECGAGALRISVDFVVGPKGAE